MPNGFRVNIRVRLDETDALGVVYYGRYLAYFDISRVGMLREVGVTFPYLRKKKIGFVAAEASCKYLAPAKMDDVLTLRVKVARMGSTSITYSHEIRRRKRVIAQGRVTDVMVGEDGKPFRIPDEIRNKLSMYFDGSGGA